MDRMKTFLKYALWLIGFFILSDFLINVGLNSNYRDIERLDKLEQVSIYQAQATKVNGRMRGMIINGGQEELNGKYIKIEFFSERKVSLGCKYIQVINLEKGKTEPFETFFELQDVTAYQVSVVQEVEPSKEIKLIPREWTKPEILLATAMAFLIFWP